MWSSCYIFNCSFIFLFSSNLNSDELSTVVRCDVMHNFIVKMYREAENGIRLAS